MHSSMPVASERIFWRDRLYGNWPPCRLMRVFSARDYEERVRDEHQPNVREVPKRCQCQGHGNDGAVLLITKDSTRAAQGSQPINNLLPICWVTGLTRLTGLDDSFAR